MNQIEEVAYWTKRPVLNSSDMQQRSPVRTEPATAAAMWHAVTIQLPRILHTQSSDTAWMIFVELIFFVAAMLNLVQDSALLEAAGQTQQVSPQTSTHIYWLYWLLLAEYRNKAKYSRKKQAAQLDCVSSFSLVMFVTLHFTESLDNILD